MTVGSLLRISAHLRAGAGVALLAFAATAAPSPAGAFSTDAAAAAQAAAATAGPVSTAATGARCIGPAFDDTPAFQAAIDTGHTVYAPALGGQCHITHALVMRTPGQIFHGDGRARTKIVIEPGFTGEGVFVAKTGGPGPQWRDIGIYFVQPNTNNFVALSVYPPAVYAHDTPAIEVDRLGCYRATICIDMRGNSGNSRIVDFAFSAFEFGIRIDGALDSIRIVDPHWWPFELSDRQRKLFVSSNQKEAIGLDVGRADDFSVSGGLFLGGLAMHFYKATNGAVGGTVTGTDFDSFSGIAMTSGSLQISASTFTLADKTAQAIHMTGGSLTLTSVRLFAGTGSQLPMIYSEHSSLTVSGCEIEMAWFDRSAIVVGDTASAIVMATRFGRSPGLHYEIPTIAVARRGNLIAVGNGLGPLSGGLGTFIESEPFSSTIIRDNASFDWSYHLR